MELKTNKDKISYIIGEDIGGSLFREGYDLEIEVMIDALRMAAKGDTQNLLSEEEKNTIMAVWQQEMQAKKQAQMQQEGLQAREEGKLFLTANRNQEGVKETESGLQYKVIQEGTGVKPMATDTVNVHYHGKLINGNVFDSSVERGEPISFPLNQVIQGWTEGLQLMTVGSKYTFFIPADLAYGDSPVGTIPAGSTLVFDVELLGVN
ncbi:Outer membrane protein MIP [bioreactor metagenome]|jgi:FKBP-type peptidyl-prolyl cis-trans isomerase FkpA/FKBP-type peptidyl-prolyl cis-trans isomerase FklB|uniref:peptidylprolyl isomerase n=1 Tax=bioreactor metagenome TaxID=1076179 RepID=A0A644U128_9ZZZZ|nr:FKBP-type peptidyl-prolyl cis-trans isomerase [Bacteroidales bacterium]MDD3668559.1 FKBP-type peptidyl-prolyl cis-trans isomerase [Bacteroidales bacterium]MEA4966708.1 FKBP-type peptidyl-prolyl cis-trans isomerase [Bacteroidaceae bacterium]MEA5099824.1 FKBP-type peptidyl-prolyl cis-trans isomerase [Bacteroidales bacterium]